MDSFIDSELKYNQKPKARSRMQDLAARSNAKPRIVTIRTMAGKVNQYVGNVK